MLNFISSVFSTDVFLQVLAAFSFSAQGVRLTDKGREQFYDDGIRVQRRQITFDNFINLPSGEYYWLLPEKFLGNKVM